jgi:hypothetical protein
MSRKFPFQLFDRRQLLTKGRVCTLFKHALLAGLSRVIKHEPLYSAGDLDERKLCCTVVCSYKSNTVFNIDYGVIR